MPSPRRRITHATPGATYSHIANRDWESDAAMPPEAIAAGCADIARQLVEMPYGDGFEVAMGGGRGNFLPETAADPEDEGKKGKRKDGKDLTKAWLDRYGNSGAYVWNQEQFDAIDPAKIDHLLGPLRDARTWSTSTTGRRTRPASRRWPRWPRRRSTSCRRTPRAIVLMIEGGRIDHGSHDGNAFRTLSDAVALNEAVKAVLRKVDLDETLIVVTGDHSHTLTIAGYAKRGNPILGISIGVDGKPILADGRQALHHDRLRQRPGRPKEPKERATLTMEQATAPDFIQQSLVPMPSETHGGEDLGIYAIGPWSHLFQGTVEENYTFHVMDYASKISERAKAAAVEPAAAP